MFFILASLTSTNITTKMWFSLVHSQTSQNFRKWRLGCTRFCPGCWTRTCWSWWPCWRSRLSVWISGYESNHNYAIWWRWGIWWRERALGFGIKRSLKMKSKVLLLVVLAVTVFELGFAWSTISILGLDMSSRVY